MALTREVAGALSHAELVDLAFEAFVLDSAHRGEAAGHDRGGVGAVVDHPSGTGGRTRRRRCP
jgi:hypothetical protein